MRYVPGKVTLDQIIKRYDETPFGVVLVEPILTINRKDQVTIRGWSERISPSRDTDKQERDKDELSPNPIHLFVELVPAGQTRIAESVELSLADPPATGLARHDALKKTAGEESSVRFVAKLYETVALKPGEITMPVNINVATINEDGAQQKHEGKLQVVLRTTADQSTGSDGVAKGVALIGPSLELRLGHLCDQRGCVDHFHRSLGQISGLGAVRAFPSLDEPRANVFLRVGQAVDIWRLRERLRDESIEIAGMAMNDFSECQLRIELPRWQSVDEQAASQDHSHAHDEHDGHHHGALNEVRQCMNCRERMVQTVENLDWATNVVVAGGGINFRLRTPRVDLVSLLDTITSSGAAPTAVWLVPADVPMPKASPSQIAHHHPQPMEGGSRAHPVVEFDLVHTCDIGESIPSMFNHLKWTSRTHVESGDLTVASAAIADRTYANLTPLLQQLRSVGQIPRQIRLREFGDIRIQLEFAHICGDVVYSKPPKPKKKKDDDKKEDAKPKKTFVPQPVAAAKTSNGRMAIEEAIANVGWIKDAVFQDYHTRFEFRGGPRKVWLGLHTSGEDVVRLDQLIDGLRHAGFPPKSVTVSRLHSGIPFGKPLPGDVELTDSDGKKLMLGAIKKIARPLALAFVSLRCQERKYGEYKADPRFYEQLRKTIESYSERVDVVAISSNKDDEFTDVAEFWDKTGLNVPLLHDAQGTAGAVLNAQTTPPPHIYVFDSEGLLRYGGDPHDNWEKPEEKQDDYLARALDLVLAQKYQLNAAVFYNKSVCNCSDPKCKCPKCACGSSCRCSIGHCKVGF